MTKAQTMRALAYSLATTPSVTYQAATGTLLVMAVHIKYAPSYWPFVELFIEERRRHVHMFEGLAHWNAARDEAIARGFYEVDVNVAR